MNRFSDEVFHPDRVAGIHGWSSGEATTSLLFSVPKQEGVMP
jgi:hypothetical protein